jgi:O-antigen/teichoic acid export membrane protein
MLKAPLLRLAKGSLIYGVGGMLQRFMSLLLLPFFTSALTTEDYGVIALIALLGVVLNGLFSLGTGNSLAVLYFREKKLDKRPSIIWTNVLLLYINICFWYAILYLIAPTISSILFQSDSHSNLIRVSLIGLALSTISEPLLGYLRMEEKVSKYVVITLASSVFSIGISIWFVLIQDLGVNGFVMAGTLAQGIMLIFVWAVVGRKLHFQIEKNLLLPLIKIGFPSIFGLFAFLIIDYADRQMIQRMIDLNALGIYLIGYSFGMVMSVVVGAFASAWPPFFMSYINKPQEARILFARVLNFYLIFFGLFVVLFFF